MRGEHVDAHSMDRMTAGRLLQKWGTYFQTDATVDEWDEQRKKRGTQKTFVAHRSCY
jgi:hypothetical protein